MTDDTFREQMREALGESDEVKKVDEECGRSSAKRLFFVSADATDADGYEGINKRLDEIESGRPREQRNRFFYLAVPPSVFEPIVRAAVVERARAADRRPESAAVGARRRREAVRPQPRDGARSSMSSCSSLFAEHQVYRIDHFLGKETVQNVLVLRFANSIFEPLWNRRWISHVQITAAETVGVEARGKYYEEAGVVRDMFQNHLLQLLALTAMEPPSR